jgi:hypothetical protein
VCVTSSSRCHRRGVRSCLLVVEPRKAAVRGLAAFEDAFLRVRIASSSRRIARWCVLVVEPCGGAAMWDPAAFSTVRVVASWLLAAALSVCITTSRVGACHVLAQYVCVARGCGPCLWQHVPACAHRALTRTFVEPRGAAVGLAAFLTVCMVDSHILRVDAWIRVLVPCVCRIFFFL